MHCFYIKKKYVTDSRILFLVEIKRPAKNYMDYSEYIALENHFIGFDVYETTLWQCAS